MQMHGQQAIVIGGAQGAGRALSRALIAAGARVTVAAPGEGVAETFAATIGQQGIDCDPGDDASLLRLAHAGGEFGLVVVALAATGGDPGPMVAAVRSIDAVLGPAMAARGGGAFLFVLTLPPAPDPWHEAAAGWLAAAVAALAARHAGAGLRVNAVVALADDSPALPSFMSTSAPAAPPTAPLGALPCPREIAAAALALCGSGARVITGQVLRLDGGQGRA